MLHLKRLYGKSMRTVAGCLEKFFSANDTRLTDKGFIYAFFPFLFGVYPYTVVDRQAERSDGAGSCKLCVPFHP